MRSRARRATAASFTAGIALQAARFGQPLGAALRDHLRAARRRSPCAARAAAGATPSFSSPRLALDGRAGIWALAGDTDGIDGSEDNAGAIIGARYAGRAAGAGLDVVRHLANNDAYSVFWALGDLVVTGPTRTNVNDFRAAIIGGPPQ